MEAPAENDETFLVEWWARKYGVPTTDPRVREQTIGGLLREYLADVVARRDQLIEAYKTADPMQQTKLREQVTALDKWLGIVENTEVVPTGDALIDYWDAEIEAGRIPDFTLTEPPK